MPALLCIKTGRGAHARGNFLQVWRIDHSFRPGETLAAWLADGRALADWPNTFFVVYVDVGPDNEDAAVEKMKTLLTEVDVEDTVVYFKDKIASGSLVSGGFVIKQREIKRRRHYLAVDALPATAKAKIRDESALKVTLIQIRQFIRNRDTDLTVDVGL